MRKKIVVWLLMVLWALALMAASCEPDPGGDWNGNDGSPMDAAYATETYGAEQFHLQLTALAGDK